jgi:hypothetical protein
MTYLYINCIVNNKNKNLQCGKGENMAKKVRCAANTKDGKRCKNTASGNSKNCATHNKK